MKGIWTLILFSFCFTLSVSAQKNDTIYFANGDKLTGELKRAEFGLVTLSTEALESVNIEYDKIQTIYCNKFFEIRLTDGNRYFGAIMPTKAPNAIVIVAGRDSLVTSLENVVQISLIKKRFVQKLDGSVGAGFNYTKASDVLQLNVSSNVTYRNNNYSIKFDQSSIVTDNGEGSISRNNEVGFYVTRFLQHKWFVGVQTNGQQNTELNLAYRFQTGAGPGYDLIRNNHVRIYSMTGIVFNNEQTLDSGYTYNNAEALFSIQSKWFKFNEPELDISCGLTYYPTLTVKNRHRLNFDLDARIEVVKDLFIGITVYERFESKNLSDGEEKSDNGIISTISFTF